MVHVFIMAIWTGSFHTFRKYRTHGLTDLLITRSRYARNVLEAALSQPATDGVVVFAMAHSQATGGLKRQAVAVSH